MRGAPRKYPRNGNGCVIEGCPFDHYRSGFCSACYIAVRRHAGLNLPDSPRKQRIEMTPIALERAGLSLYGDDWYGPLARDLEVKPVTVRKWHSGAILISFKAHDAIMALLASRPQPIIRM